MDIDQVRKVFLLGVGGIGMSGLARYFRHLGCEVAGYDKTETELTQTLAAEGICINYTDDPAQLPAFLRQASSEVLVIFTPAIPKDLSIKTHLEQIGHTLYKRSQVLGFISENRFTIAVGGTHGKTTTSTMIAHMLKDSGYDCSAFLGGISSNYGSNVLFGANKTLVVEADEYDRSFLTLHPNIAIVTSADADHLDIYGDKSHLIESFELFLGRVIGDGVRIVKTGLPFAGDIAYSLHGPADAYATDIRVKEGAFYFDYHADDWQLKDIKLGIPGLHNIENAVSAITVGRLLGIEGETIKSALASFQGVRRRFEFVVRTDSCVYIDDYAHHPEELRAFFASVRKLYPGKKLTVIFQPHLFSRTRDFADGFAEVLGQVDVLLLMDIYPAREMPLEGVTSQWLLDKVKVKEKKLVSALEAKAYVQAERPELLATVGAGDIDRLVKPLKNILEHGE